MMIRSILALNDRGRNTLSSSCYELNLTFYIHDPEKVIRAAKTFISEEDWLEDLNQPDIDGRVEPDPIASALLILAYWPGKLEELTNIGAIELDSSESGPSQPLTTRSFAAGAAGRVMPSM
jgi:hypothetical protein